MLLAEQSQIRKNPALSLLCHRTKNLYNLANFYVRQELFYMGDVLTFYDLDFMLRGQPAYQTLPVHTTQQVLWQVARAWCSYFTACKEYEKKPGKFLGVPRSPRYKQKGGECVAIFTNQQCRTRDGCLYFPRKAGLPPIRTRVTRFQQVRVVPKGIYYIIEVVYHKEAAHPSVDSSRAIGIDLGVANLITAVNNVSVAPFAISGGATKSANQFFNKELARLRSASVKANAGRTTKRLQRLTRTRANKVGDIFHKASRMVINFCTRHHIGTIAIGYNPRWKQNCNLGRQNNQEFEFLPFHTLIQQIEYKAELAGIAVILVDECYTSRCSFLDGEAVGQHTQYAGQRVKRGLFRTRAGVIINADVNAAYNILQQGVPEAFADGIEGAGLHPVLIGLA